MTPPASSWTRIFNCKDSQTPWGVFSWLEVSDCSSLLSKGLFDMFCTVSTGKTNSWASMVKKKTQILWLLLFCDMHSFILLTGVSAMNFCKLEALARFHRLSCIEQISREPLTYSTPLTHQYHTCGTVDWSANHQKEKFEAQSYLYEANKQKTEKLYNLNKTLHKGTGGVSCVFLVTTSTQPTLNHYAIRVQSHKVVAGLGVNKLLHDKKQIVWIASRK